MATRTITRRKTKIPFKQPEYDRLVTRKAKAILVLRRARQELADYVETHTSGIPRKRRDEIWV